MKKSICILLIIVLLLMTLVCCTGEFGKQNKDTTTDIENDTIMVTGINQTKDTEETTGEPDVDPMEEVTIVNTQRVKEYMTEIYASGKTLSGAKIDPFKTGNSNAVNNFLNEFKAVTGKEPALLGLDVYEGNYNTLSFMEKQTVANQLAEYYRRGGIITISSHITNPSGVTADMENKYNGDLGNESAWIDVITSGTTLNSKLKAGLSIPLDLLTRLNKLGVPVLWRPYHEMSSGEFWWGIKQTIDGTEKVMPASCYQNLWKWTYTYFTEEKGLNNLIWVYAPTPRDNILTEADGGVMYCYPGDEYVDIIGLDCYFNTRKGTTYSAQTTFNNAERPLGYYSSNGGNQFARVYDFIKKNYPNKIIVFSESGFEGSAPISTQTSAFWNTIIESMATDGKYMGYFMFWSGQNLHQMSDKENSVLLNNERVITLDKSTLHS